MMKHALATLSLTLCLLGSACAQKAEVHTPQTLAALASGPKGAAGTMFLGLYYCGDKDGDSYFVLRRKLVADQWLKIKATDWPEKPHFDFTKEEKRWKESHKAAAGLKK